MKNKVIIAFAAMFGLLGVIFGALGAHALEASLEPDQLESYRTAVRYQVWHALGLLFVAAMSERLGKAGLIAGLWIAGVILFSGSIYLLSLDELMGLNLSWLGPVTPFGGLLMILGWLILFISALRSR